MLVVVAAALPSGQCNVNKLISECLSQLADNIITNTRNVKIDCIAPFLNGIDPAKDKVAGQVEKFRLTNSCSVVDSCGVRNTPQQNTNRRIYMRIISQCSMKKHGDISCNN